jgi:diguanylate cyclase (GGDEF)-like protein
MSIRRPGGSRLFTVYAAASLLPVLALGGVLLHGYQQQAEERGRDQGRAQAAVIEEMAIAPALSGDDLSGGLSDHERNQLQAATDLAIFNGSVTRLRLRSFEGDVSFSDDGTETGAVPVSDPAFQAAARGQTDVRVLHDATLAPGGVIRVMQPVVADTTGQATGVLEVYLPYDAIAAKVQAETTRTIWRLGLGLLGLYAVLALISWWTTRSLRRHAAQREHEALHDLLTGLPNRGRFRATAEEAIARGRRGERGALVLVDLDRFKEVNDTLGHHAGDELLRIVGQRLTESVRTDDLVARLGGDEFGLILPRVSDKDGTVALLTRVREHLAQEIVLDGVSLSVEASFGVAFYPDDAADVEGLLQCADAAMYQGKHGATGVVVYEPRTAAHPTHSLVVQQELRLALEREELVLFYQPRVDLTDGSVAGVEALIRWRHPERGLLAPSEFLPVAERSGLIEPITDWVLRRALRDEAEWRALGVPWTVAVNVSARNLESPQLHRTVRELISADGGTSDRLHLEVTETALAMDATAAAEVVSSLAGEGLTIAIDDFGIGYTSLSQLRTLPVSEIKIDRTFVSDLDDNAQDRAIVRSIIELGHSLGFRVTAEGVETRGVAEWLTAAGCDHAQGFLWSKPLPWRELAARFALSTSVPAPRRAPMDGDVPSQTGRAPR